MFETVLFFVPLCLVVFLVYAATKRDGAGAILREGLHLFLVTVGGLAGLAVVIYLISRFIQPRLWF